MFMATISAAAAPKASATSAARGDAARGIASDAIGDVDQAAIHAIMLCRGCSKYVAVDVAAVAFLAPYNSSMCA
jgi:hypothetical protein